MGLLSRFTDWSRPAADILLVADADCALARHIAEHLDSMDTSYELASSLTNSNRPCVHFLSTEKFARAGNKRIATTNQLIVNISHCDLDNKPLVERLATVNNLVMVADSSATSTQLQRHGFDSVATIGEGLWQDEFKPASIDRRLSARRQLKVPLDAHCVGVFEQLSSDDQDFLLDVATRLNEQLGPLCLIIPGPKSKLDRRLRSAGISVARVNPRTIEEVLKCYWSLDMYLNIGEIGEPRGVLRSWATGVAIVSRPNTVANDLLYDGLTAAVSESGRCQLCRTGRH